MPITVDCGLICGLDCRVMPRADQGNKGSATLLRATRKPRFPLSTTCTDLDKLDGIRAPHVERTISHVHFSLQE